MKTREELQNELKWAQENQSSYDFYLAYAGAPYNVVAAKIGNELKRLNAAENKAALDEFLAKKAITKCPPGFAVGSGVTKDKLK